jgi:hypothetical protein
MDKSRYILRCDAKQYHQVSDKFFCTTAFLNGYLAAIIHPFTKGAISRVVSFLESRSGDKGHLLPTGSDFYHTLFEKMLAHPSIKCITNRCRTSCDVRVLGIDGCYKSLMSVLYQVPHGMSHDRADDEDDGGDGLHVLLTVQCKDSLLNIHGAYSENPIYQVQALCESVGKGEAKQVRMICSDSPGKLDGCAQLHRKFSNLLCVSKDILHIAINIEKATNEKKTRFSCAVRRCLAKLRLGGFNRARYYCKSSGATGPSELSHRISVMRPSVASRVYERLHSEPYIKKPYDGIFDFVHDLAAVCKSHPDMVAKKTAGKKQLSSRVWKPRPQSKNLAIL